MTTSTDTIAAIATAPGAGGVGIVRLSGPASQSIARTLCGRALRPRHAHHVRFSDADGAVLDDGLALAFPGPASYTGEDVVELQAHGSPVVLQQLLARCRALGARLARPGEFSERAFLNGRLVAPHVRAMVVPGSGLVKSQAEDEGLDAIFKAGLRPTLLLYNDEDLASALGPLCDALGVRLQKSKESLSVTEAIRAMNAGFLPPG